MPVFHTVFPIHMPFWASRRMCSAGGMRAIPAQTVTPETNEYYSKLCVVINPHATHANTQYG